MGLDNKKFCILNRQYTEEEYWLKVDEIKTAMFARGEYGEFFPPEHLPFPYRIAMVTNYNGFRDFETVAKYGYDVAPVLGEREEGRGDILAAESLPDDIQDVTDEILEKIIFDQANNKHFRFIRPELEFYRRYRIPLPREHPSIRMQKWRNHFNLRLQFFRRSCPICEAEFETTYLPDFQGTVYCESCYQKQLVS